MTGTAVILSGTEVSKEMRLEMAEEVKRLKESLPEFVPRLAIVQVGGREDSNVYIRMKIKAASEIGIEAEHIKLPRSTTQSQVCLVSVLVVTTRQFDLGFLSIMK
ncbi:hypothetical protein J6590_022859 [Homalodisca vitripennis]|nr:hypothetical protein J6590_022859 [Homalodisca vitripennis]